MYKGITLISFFILIGVLLYLTYITFMFNDREYQSTEKALIKEHYAQSIRNDKVYPGGQHVLDRYIIDNIDTLKELSQTNPDGFARYSNILLDSLFAGLRKASTMDSLFARIKQEYDLNDELEYLLSIQSISVAFQHPHQITLFLAEAPQTALQDSLTNSYGLVVSGGLQRPLEQNLITSYTVSSPSDYSYSITFSLHADRRNRYLHVFRRMLPTLLMGLFSVVSVASVYYITYRKWIRQKKLAEMKSDFLNSITHEFNTPLSTIIVANKNMQHEKIAANPGSIKTLTSIIDRQAARLQKLFGQVMDITTTDSNSLAKEPVDINLLLNDIVTDYQLKASDQGADLSMTLNPEPAIVELNRFSFTTMVLNLFDNAIKYNQNKNKTITVQVVPTPSDVQVIIADNGVGIPEHEKEHIFEKFYRLREQGTQSISGLGLGLYYVYQSIKNHGWTLSVNSKVNQGSQFVIHIPRKQ